MCCSRRQDNAHCARHEESRRVVCKRCESRANQRFDIEHSSNGEKFSFCFWLLPQLRYYLLFSKGVTNTIVSNLDAAAFPGVIGGSFFFDVCVFLFVHLSCKGSIVFFWTLLALAWVSLFEMRESKFVSKTIAKALFEILFRFRKLFRTFIYVATCRRSSFCTRSTQ